MVSFIIASKDKQKRLAYENDFCEKQQINRFDITIIENDTTTKQTSQSIGIEDVKLIQKKLFLKPIKSKTKAVIIEDAQLLTPEGQNALLKILEEPPAQTIIMLGSETKEAFLPTILSRCQIITLEEDQSQLSEKEQEDFNIFIKQLSHFTIGECLKKAEQLAKDKNDAISWIEKVILVMRNETVKEYLIKETATNTKMINYLRSFQTLYTILKTTNINPRFAIENTLLQLTLI